jgi:methylated-DNA-[protein]-cysteine S-methyltransferase
MDSENEPQTANGLILLCAAGGFILMETLHCTNVDSAIGPLFLAASGRGLVALEFDARLPGQQRFAPTHATFGKKKMPSRSRIPLAPCGLTSASWKNTFAGKRREFSFPLDLRGTDFQLACWRALLAIPYGETRSYADIARAVGKPNAFRAVGMANNRNPIAIVVPCHRVIASDGSCAATAEAST